MPHQLDVPVFDADNHMYETREALTKYLPEKYKNLLRYVEVDGRTKIVVKGQISEYIPNPTFDVVARPGAQEEYYRVGNPEGKSRREIFGKPIRSIPAFRNPEDRVKLMDEQGLDRALMFPTLASLVEERFRDDPDAIHAIVHALNQWMYETWQFNYENRIFSTPVISPLHRRAGHRGAGVGARAGGQGDPRAPGTGARAPGLALVRAARVRPVLGACRRGRHPRRHALLRQRLLAVHQRLDGPRRRDAAVPAPGLRACSRSWRPVEDAVSALICHGALSRFPTLKIAVIENGSSWVEPLLKTFKDAYKKMPQDFPEDPVEIFKRNIYISPFWEEDLAELAELIGEDHVLFGSDYPHPEGLGDPVSYVNELAGQPEELVRKIMGGNLTKLMNLEEPALR